MKNRGFTLVEMAIVLIIVSAVSGMLISGLSVFNQHVHGATTYARQVVLKNALIGYLRDNKRLPCPSSDLANPGVESSAPASNTCVDAVGKPSIAPYVTLGIPKEAAQDGWGNFFTYVVSSNPGLTGDYSRDWVSQSSVPSGAIEDIEVVDSQGVSLPAVVVLISHGPSGDGGWTENGQQTSVELISSDASDADKLGNAAKIANGKGCIDRRSILRSCYNYSNTPVFDDLVFSMSREDLLGPLYKQGARTPPEVEWNKLCQAARDLLITNGLTHRTSVPNPDQSGALIYQYNISPSTSVDLYLVDPTNAERLNCSKVAVDTKIGYGQSIGDDAICDVSTAQSVPANGKPLSCSIKYSDLMTIFANTAGLKP